MVTHLPSTQSNILKPFMWQGPSCLLHSAGDCQPVWPVPWVLVGRHDYPGGGQVFCGGILHALVVCSAWDRSIRFSQRISSCNQLVGWWKEHSQLGKKMRKIWLLPLLVLWLQSLMMKYYITQWFSLLPCMSTVLKTGFKISKAREIAWR